MGDPRLPVHGLAKSISAADDHSTHTRLRLKLKLAVFNPTIPPTLLRPLHFTFSFTSPVALPKLACWISEPRAQLEAGSHRSRQEHMFWRCILLELFPVDYEFASAPRPDLDSIMRPTSTVSSTRKTSPSKPSSTKTNSSRSARPRTPGLSTISSKSTFFRGYWVM